LEARRSTAFFFGCLLLVLILTLSRSPTVLAEPRFWAEEGVIYFAYAYQHGFFAALHGPLLAYFMLFPNLGAALALLVPVEWAPAVTLYLALAIQLAVSAVALTTRSPRLASPWARLAIALAVPLLAPMEIWLTTISAQFWLCIATFLVLQDEDMGRGGRLRRWTFRALLAAGGLSGVSSCFLTPFFVAKAWRTRAREDRIHAAILAVTSVVQLVDLAVTVLEGGQGLRGRFDAIELSPMKLALWHLLVPIAGLEPYGWKWVYGFDVQVFRTLVEWFGPAAQQLARASLLLTFVPICAALGALFVAGMRSAREREAWLVWLTVIVLQTAGSFQLAGAPRYAFPANLMLTVILLGEALTPARRWRRRTAATLLAIALASNLFFYWSRVFEKLSGVQDRPRWREEVARWRLDPAYAPRIWPQFKDRSWRVELRRPDAASRPAR
jgi:hypothetical protein